MVDGKPISFGEYLLREGVVTQSQYNAALGKQRKTGLSLGRILVDSELITEDMRIDILKNKFGFPLVEIDPDRKVPPAILTIVPFSFADKHRAVAVRQDEDGSLVVAMEDPSDLLIVDAIKNQVGMKLKTVVARRKSILTVLKQYEAQTHSEEIEQQLRVERDWRNSFVVKIIKYALFPILALAPLIIFFLGLVLDIMEMQKHLQHWMAESEVNDFDLTLYFSLTWGIWVVVLYEIYGVIFGRSAEEED